MIYPTERQVTAAHDAWEQTVTDWKLWRVIHRADMWVVERSASARYEHDKIYTDEIAYYRFDGEDAEKKAKFFLRDKCIKAALTAALAAT